MDALLIGAVMFASVVPTTVPARTPIRFTGVKAGQVAGRLITVSDQLYTVETAGGALLTVPQPGSTLRGRLVSVDDGVMSVLLDEKQPVARIPLASVRDVRVSRGRVRSWDRGLMMGLAVGAVGGAALATSVCSDFIKCSVAEGAAVYGTLGAVIGTSIGVFAMREKWEPMEPGSFKVAVQPVRGGVGLALAFGLPRR